MIVASRFDPPVSLAMCNASRHSPSCSCGFGPPYTASYRVTKQIPWEEEAADDSAFAIRSLEQGGWDPKAVQTVAQALRSGRGPALPRSTLIERLRELVRIRERRVLASADEVVDVPLYQFAAPPVKGAKVEYIEGDTIGDTSSWSLKFRGVGVANTTSMEVSRTRMCVATNGAAKLVCVPVLVRVSTVAIIDGTTEVGRGYDAVVVPPPETDDPRLLKRSITKVARVDVPSDTPYHESLDVNTSGDTTGDPYKERRACTVDVGREVSVSLQPLADVSALVKVKRLRRLELAFELPSGHHYIARIGAGFTHWESPVRTPRPSRARRAA